MSANKASNSQADFLFGFANTAEYALVWPECNCETDCARALDAVYKMLRVSSETLSAPPNPNFGCMRTSEWTLRRTTLFVWSQAGHNAAGGIAKQLGAR